MKRNVMVTMATLALVLVSAGVVAAVTDEATDHPAETARQLDDATIVAIFDAANTADIETGALAAERGSSPEVREFGAMLVRDHEHVRKLGRDLAAKLGVTPTPPKDDAASRQHAAAMKRLRALQGPGFDHAFLQHEVEFHRSVLEAVEKTLLPEIDNAELRDLVVKVAPAFDAHMRAAAALDEKLGGPPSP